MKYHEVTNIVLVMSLVSGIYLPAVKEVIKNKFVVRIFIILSIIPLLGTPLFTATMSLPIFFQDIPSMARILNIVAGIACSSNVFKLYYFYFKRHEFIEIIRIWDESSENVLYPEMRKDFLLRNKKTTDRWITSFGAFLMISAVFYAIAPYFTRKLEHSTALPYTNASPEFDILVTYELIVQSYLCMSVHAYNSMLLQTVALENGLCQYLKKSLGVIMSALTLTEWGDIAAMEGLESVGKKNIPRDIAYHKVYFETDKKLRRWIEEHQDLIRFHEHLRSLYHPTLCVEFSGLILIICLVFFMIINNSLSPTMSFISIVYCCNIYTIFYITCFYADLASLESETMFRDAFSQGWYLFPRKIRVAYQIIVLRCKKPLQLLAFFIYPVGSGNFGRIFRHAYSFFMFLVQVMNRNKSQL